jgi:hypothetical protein
MQLAAALHLSNPKEVAVKLKLILIFFPALLLVSARGASPLGGKGMREVPFIVINKSGQAVNVELWRYEDEYPSKFYAFRLEPGTRAHPKSGTWEVWKGDYTMIVYGEDMTECLLPIDDLDLKPGVDITIKGRYRLVITPCREVFRNQGEPGQLKYNWLDSYVADPNDGSAIDGWYSNWWMYLK